MGDSRCVKCGVGEVQLEQRPIRQRSHGWEVLPCLVRAAFFAAPSGSVAVRELIPRIRPA